MMSVNLYRGKRKDNGEWVVGAALPHDNNGEITIFRQNPGDGALERFEVVPETVGQATGHNDLFTGDIVAEEFDGAKGVVCLGAYRNPFNDCGFHVGIYIDWIGKYANLLRKDFGYWMSRNDVKRIGNIDDNPELLEVE
jgi:hypothetical protein